MASKFLNMEDTLTCPICTEVFIQPVTLLCQHNYCRECLKVFSETTIEQKKITTPADHTHIKRDHVRKKDKSCINSSATQFEQSIIIYCPVCREPTQLGSRGVTGLTTNFTLAEIVEKFLADRHKEEREPLCSICEDKKKLAVKACSACCLLYCEECFTAFHSEKCTFGRHRIITVDEYLSLKKGASPAKSEEEKETSNPPPICVKHSQALSIYCVTCENLICHGCLADHGEHVAMGIEKAFEKQTVSFLENIKVCEKTEEKAAECLQEIQKLIVEIKNQERCRRSEIQRAYDAALKALETWRENTIVTVQKQHKEWLDRCDAIVTDLQINLEKTKSLVIKSNKLSSGKQVGFLQDLQTFSARMDYQLEATRGAVKTHERLMEECNMFIRDADEFRHLILTEKTIKQPKLNFTRGGSSRTRITEGGLVVEEKSPTDYHRVYTDEHFQTGQYYWEFKVIVNLGIEQTSCCICSVGVLQPESKVGALRFAMTPSWGIRVEYHDQKFKCTSIRGSRDTLPAYTSLNPYPGRHCLGFYLDCQKRTFTAVDCSQNQIMWTQRGIDVSKPLVPIIGFSCPFAYHPAVSASARLITRDNSTLQQVLRSALNSL